MAIFSNPQAPTVRSILGACLGQSIRTRVDVRSRNASVWEELTRLCGRLRGHSNETVVSQPSLPRSSWPGIPSSFRKIPAVISNRLPSFERSHRRDFVHGLPWNGAPGRCRSSRVAYPGEASQPNPSALSDELLMRWLLSIASAVC